MSSPASTRPKPAPNGEAVSESEKKVATLVSADGKSSQKLSNSSKEDRLGESNGAAAVSSVSADTSSTPAPAPGAADQQSDTASAISNGSQSENKSSRSRTRSTIQANNTGGKQNGEKGYQEQDSSSNNNSGTEEDTDPYLNALASTLARLDERAYKKALFRDANSILEKVLFPMSFPWSHKVLPVVRNIPRDIDEMPAILTIDDAEHELCALKDSIFDLHQSQVGFEKRELFDDDEKIHAVARRADEPGEIELITSAPSMASNSLSPDAKVAEDSHSVLLRDPLIEPIPRSVERVTSPKNAASSAGEVPLDAPGELYYQVFKQVQDKKRRRLEAGMARLKNLRISVKVDSTSSRATLFNRNNEQSALPLLLPATLPDGFRAGLKGKNSSRAPQGRSQLTWTEKNSTRSSQRVSFKSFLTGEKIENGAQRRPREVTVGIRVNGKLVSSAQIKADQLTKENLAVNRKQADGKIKSVYSTKIVSDAVKDTETGDHKAGKRMCTMDTEEFTKRILSRELNKETSMGWNNKITIKSLNLVYVAPRIDCMPSEDGLVHVVCTSTGELPPSNVDKVFNQACRSSDPPVCTVCWRDTSVAGELLSECSSCGVLIHLKTCQSSLSYDVRRKKCASCFQSDAASTSPSSRKRAASGAPSPERTGGRRSSRAPPKSKDGGSPMSGVQPDSCALCPHTGGAMSMIKRDGRLIWVHDVCRIWCDQATELSESENGSKSITDPAAEHLDGLTCVVCGTSNDSNHHDATAKCAAAGCSVYFHPMCALYVSKCEELGGGRALSNGNGSSAEIDGAETSTEVDAPLEKIIENDTRLCKQYSLRFTRCAIPESQYVKSPSMSMAVLPVCFCGIHNPERERSLYGLYPGGVKMIDEEIMRVPPKKITAK